VATVNVRMLVDSYAIVTSCDEVDISGLVLKTLSADLLRISSLILARTARSTSWRR
jgi:hypothetical protein